MSSMPMGHITHFDKRKHVKSLMRMQTERRLTKKTKPERSAERAFCEATP